MRQTCLCALRQCVFSFFYFDVVEVHGVRGISVAGSILASSVPGLDGSLEVAVEKASCG